MKSLSSGFLSCTLTSPVMANLSSLKRRTKNVFSYRCFLSLYGFRILHLPRNGPHPLWWMNAGCPFKDWYPDHVFAWWPHLPFSRTQSNWILLVSKKDEDDPLYVLLDFDSSIHPSVLKRMKKQTHARVTHSRLLYSTDRLHANVIWSRSVFFNVAHLPISSCTIQVMAFWIRVAVLWTPLWVFRCARAPPMEEKVEERRSPGGNPSKNLDQISASRLPPIFRMLTVPAWMFLILGFYWFLAIWLRLFGFWFDWKALAWFDI